MNRPVLSVRAILVVMVWAIGAVSIAVALAAVTAELTTGAIALRANTNAKEVRFITDTFRSIEGEALPIVSTGEAAALRDRGLSVLSFKVVAQDES
jgi:hypothetical protein